MVYVVVARLQVVPGMLAEYDAYSERFLEHCRQVPGLRSVVQSAHLSYPGRFTVSVGFEDRAAEQAWARSPELKAIAQAAGPSLLQLVSETEAWVPVAGTPPSTGAQPTFMTVTRLTINSKPGSRQAFEQRGRGGIALFEQHGRGLASAALVRLAGNTTHYAIALQFLTARDASATFAMPEIASLIAEDALRPYVVGEMETEWHEIVRVLVRQPTVAS